MNTSNKQIDSFLLLRVSIPLQMKLYSMAFQAKNDMLIEYKFSPDSTSI